MPPPGIEPATPFFPSCPSNHWAIGRDIDILLDLLHYFLIKRYYKNYVSFALPTYAPNLQNRITVGGIPKLNCFFIIIFTITICNLN